MAHTTQSVTEILSAHIANITFTKADGETVTRRATLISDHVPATKGSGRATPDHTVCFIDLDKSAWRSCRVDAIKDIVVEG